MSALYAALCDLAAARDERNAAMRDELQELADQIAARPSAETLRLRQSAPAIPRAPLPEGAYRMRTTCSLCGDPSDMQVCARCSVGLVELGL